MILWNKISVVGLYPNSVLKVYVELDLHNKEFEYVSSNGHKIIYIFI